MEISVLIGAIGCCLAIATFFVGRQGYAHTNGKEEGNVQTNIEYIKESLNRIESRLNDDVKRLEGRIDEISTQMVNISGASAKASESAKTMKEQLKEHLEREHKVKVLDKD